MVARARSLVSSRWARRPAQEGPYITDLLAERGASLQMKSGGSHPRTGARETSMTSERRGRQPQEAAVTWPTRSETDSTLRTPLNGPGSE